MDVVREAVANLHQDDFALAAACRSVHLSCDSRYCHVGKRAAHKHFPIYHVNRTCMLMTKRNEHAYAKVGVACRTVGER